MTERHHQSSAGSTYIPAFDYCKPTTSEIVCVSPDMVATERLSEEPNTLTSDSTNEHVHVDESAGDTSSDSDDCISEKGQLEVAGPDEDASSFGNVVVKNSSEVQFGNNTYYEGPVVIKQFVYKGPQNDRQLSIENGAQDNPSFITDGDANHVEPISDCVIKCDKNNIIDNNASTNNNIVDDNVQKGTKWVNYVYRNRILFLSFSTISIIALIVCLTLLLGGKRMIKAFPEDSDEQDQSNPIKTPIEQDPDADLSTSGKLRIIPRIEWLARPPSHPANLLPTPVPYVIILHTATTNCSDQTQCIKQAKLVQKFHMDSKGWWDIAYNFLVGGDGLAYEGRGWTNEGANAFGYNTKSIGIAFIGTFNIILPPHRQINAAKKLIEEGVTLGYIREDYKLLAHTQLSGTQSPGELLYKDMKTWPHWFQTCGELSVGKQLENALNGTHSCG